MKVTGEVAGATRNDLVRDAARQAAEFFGTECVQVRLGQAQATVPGLFRADYTAQEHHNTEARAYGPPRCRNCDQDSWPTAPLAKAVWS